MKEKVLKLINFFKKWHHFLCFVILSTIIFHGIGLLCGLEKLSTFLFYIVSFIGGVPLVWQIIKKLLVRNITADLIALLAFVLAIYLQQPITAVLILLMLATGSALEDFASHKASFALETLMNRIPSLAHLKKEDNFFDIKLSEIKINDLIAIFPFEIAPVDGEVIEGYGSMDESYLTGEPYKINKTIGSQVLSGSINGESTIVIRATKLTENSRYAQIVEIMKKAQAEKPNLQKIADRVAVVFIPLTLLIAGFCYYFTHDLTRFLAVLTIATPCPLLIAVPITIMSAISMCAKQGIIIRDAKIFEYLPLCTTAIFDKTGTLTYGEPKLTKIINISNYTESQIIQKVASLERHSRHPLASAVLHYAKEQKIILTNANQVSEKPGYGISGVVGNFELIITNRANAKNFVNQENLPQIQVGLECVIVINNIVACVLIFEDVERPETGSFISHLGLEHNFSEVILLSGDRQKQVDYLGVKLGIKKCYGGKSPEEKLSIVKKYSQKSPTLFVGDGINDAPALCLATASIAFAQHNQIAGESANAVILENNLLKVDKLMHLSLDTRKIAMQSAVGGMLFSLLGMILASFGYISPAEGAILQQIIDVIAIFNALRLIFITKV
jgi:heavy metal translocating P-type ATPase